MDTGWFRYSNTDHRVLVASAILVGKGVRPNELFQRLFQCESKQRVRLLGAALGSLELLAHDRVAVMSLSVDAMSACGASRLDTEDIVNEPLRIGSVIISVLLVEQEDGLVRASFRSREPFESDKSSASAVGEPVIDVDVAKLAATFGGGGHARAAGARIKGTLADVRQILIEHLEQCLPE
jgi:phosphoesterase RecJ-like protein